MGEEDTEGPEHVVEGKYWHRIYGGTCDPTYTVLGASRYPIYKSVGSTPSCPAEHSLQPHNLTWSLQGLRLTSLLPPWCSPGAPQTL